MTWDAPILVNGSPFPFPQVISNWGAWHKKSNAKGFYHTKDRLFRHVS
jgi:hypothetical protein